MKKLYTIFLVSASAAMFVACQGLNNIPEFESTESFASFPLTAVALNENMGQVVIPVEIASIQPVQTVVSYKITDGSAKAGVDYKDTNSDAVLTFDGTKRSQDIVIDIFDRSGEYTGDLSFTIELVSAKDLKLSAEKTCTVKIQDLDHPLASILGEYSGSAVSSYDGAVSWTMTLVKDPDDVTMVWISGVTNEYLSASQMFYANVIFGDEDEILGLSVPAGQKVPDGSYLAWLVGNKAGSGSYFPEDPLIWMFNGTTLVYEPQGDMNSIGIIAVYPNDPNTPLGWFNRYDVPPTFVKK